MATRAKRNLLESTTTGEADSIADRYPFRHPLDTGDRGALVLWAQSKLAEHGCYKGELDGRFDREVALAAREFQSRNNLTITGIIDRRTWDAL